MALFQNTVVKQYTSSLDSQKLHDAWEKYQSYFLNFRIQQNIISQKEEQFQEGFLRELFVNILGYTISPEPDYNLITELKNEKDSKKADGAILDGKNILAIIELKSTKVTDLGKIETQAFNYKNNQKNCRYVITSNFRKLRFYIDNAIEYIEWDLFTLNSEDFKTLYLCLNKSSIYTHIPARIKEESVSIEEEVTKRLYKEYSTFRKELFNSISSLNPSFDRLLLFKKTQKLLDRFLFLLFAEDRLLVPANSVRNILQQWVDLKERFDEYQPLYDRFKKYFGYLDKGHKSAQHEIFAYNGGLFEPDVILDNIKIDDTILYNATYSISRYDFNSDVDVNILGHIFEHSLTEIEEVESQIIGNGTVLIEKSTKRKKDGVFYTPKYITKFVVANSIGNLCSAKKESLQLFEEDYVQEQSKAKKKSLLTNLDIYRQWLLHITILDPACGSGAFLNQALEYLISEHKWINELEAKITGSAIVFDLANSILENNLFGVDINEESVEIAKLSLWLRTAQKGRKLTSLSNNIKCGNSLISNVEVAGDKAFDWNTEFPDVLSNGGFDIIIGNPPYIRVQGLRGNFEKESLYFENEFKSATGRFDIYVLFMEKACQLINDKGSISFILPHKFTISDFGNGIRKYLLENKSISKIISFGSDIVFSEAATYTCIVTLSRGNTKILFKEIRVNELFDDTSFIEVGYDKLSEEKWNLHSSETTDLFEVLKKQPLVAEKVFKNISQGIVTICDDIFLLSGKYQGKTFIGYSERLQKEVVLEAEVVKPFVKGENIQRYEPVDITKHIIYLHKTVNKKTLPFEEDEVINYPLVYSYLKQFQDELISRKVKYKTNPKYWYSLHRSRELEILERPKLLMRNFSFKSQITLDLDKLFYNSVSYGITLDDDDINKLKYYLGILNSELMWFYMLNTSPVLRGGFVQYKTTYIENFPLPDYNYDNAKALIQLVDEILLKSNALHDLNKNFIAFLLSKFEGIVINNKIEEWSLLTFNAFLKELAKQKIKLSLIEQNEWSLYFREMQTKINDNRLEVLDAEERVNKLVYGIYNLSIAHINLINNTSI